MAWWKWLEVGIDFGVPALMLAVGLWLILRVGLGKWRRKAARRCFGCGYDMRETAGLVCPECGYEAKGQKLVERGRVRWRWLAVGVLLCAPGIWLAGFWVLYTPKALARRAVEARYDDEYKLHYGPVSLRVNYQGQGVDEERGAADFRYRVFVWLMEDPAEMKSFCGIARGYFSPPDLEVTLEPGSVNLPSHLSYRDRVAVFLAHLFLYPQRHYGAYLPYIQVDEVVIEGTGAEVVPDAAHEDMKVFDELKDFAVFEMRVDDRLLGFLAKQKTLETVDMEKVEASAEGVALLGGLRELEHVRLSFERAVTTKEVEALSRVRGLTGLSLRSEKAEQGEWDAVLAKLVESHRLEDLILDFPMEMKPNGTAKLPKAVAGCKTLRRLELDVSGWTSQELQALGGLQKLYGLWLRCEPARRVDVKTEMGWLKQLKLSSCMLEGFEGEGLDALVKEVEAGIK